MNESETVQQQTSMDQGTQANEPKTSTKKFIFRSKSSGGSGDDLVVIIPERIEASYGLYVWPSAHLLAWYLFEHRQFLRSKKVLEVGTGTGLPGIVAALCGAQVTLSDSSKLPHCLEQAKKSAEANGLSDRIKIIGITWGFFLSDLIKLRGEVDLIIGSDCFYDPCVFEDLICTVAYILEQNPTAKFLSSYQERSSDWSIVSLLSKWGLESKQILFNQLANSCEIDLPQILQGHTVQLIEITLKGYGSSKSS